MDPLRPIRSDEEHRWALAEVERLWNSEPATPDGDRMEVLAMLVEDYEEKNYPIGLPHPIEAIKCTLEQREASPADLAPLFGGPEIMAEILAKRRHMTIEMVWALSERLRIGIDVLAQKYDLD
jgi:HTH-type transcriptional regulator/antitoxin HigA